MVRHSHRSTAAPLHSLAATTSTANSTAADFGQQGNCHYIGDRQSARRPYRNPWNDAMPSNVALIQLSQLASHSSKGSNQEAVVSSPIRSSLF